MENIEKEVKILEVPKEELIQRLNDAYVLNFRWSVRDKKFDSSDILQKDLKASLRIRTKIFDIIKVEPNNSPQERVWFAVEDFSDNLYRQTWTIKQKVKSVTDGTKTKLEYSDCLKNFDSFEGFVQKMKEILWNYQDDFQQLFDYHPDKKEFKWEQTFIFFITKILGLKISEKREKHRMEWQWGEKNKSVKWTIDQYSDIPAFSEIEWTTWEIIRQEVEKFWLSNYIITDWWYKKLKKYYGK